MSTSEAQEDGSHETKPQEQHAWLHRLVGEWTFDGDCSMGPDKPREAFSGTQSVRSLGGLWIVGEGRGEMPGGGDSTTLLTVGYNPATERFVGTWVGSMMAHLWVYDGWLDEAERVLTLEAEGPSMTEPGATATYRDVVELASDDHWILRAEAKASDGSWTEFMTTNYRRTA